MNNLKYPKKIVWKRTLNSNQVMDNFSKKHSKRLQSVIAKLDTLKITHTINLIDDTFLEWFKEFYQNNINKKNNPNFADIDSMLSTYNVSTQCYGLKIMEDGKVVGGAIYINKKRQITTALKIFNPNWYGENLPASPTLFSEYILYTHAIEHGYSLISHGKDSNPYGINSNIGLCAFKLSLGYTPSVSKNYETGLLNESEINEDCLVLLEPGIGNEIKKGKLFCSQETLVKYEMVTNYKDTLDIEVNLIHKL